MINQNQEAFLQMLMDGGEEEGSEVEGSSGREQYIQITPEEDAAIQRVLFYFIIN